MMYWKMHYYKGKIAGTEVAYSFRHPETASCFGSWISESEVETAPVIIPEEAVLDWETQWGFPDDCGTEFGLSVFYTSDILLKKGQCVFHAAAFLWNGRAYLLTAASGTGKSTQLKNLLSLYPEEIKVMNGDKPVIGTDKDGRLMVYPSPWKGKERWGDDSLTAPAGGIVILKQGKTNEIRQAAVREAVPFLMSRFLFTAQKRESVLSAAALEDRFLRTVPAWIFTNTGSIEGSKVLFEALKTEGESQHEIQIS